MRLILKFQSASCNPCKQLSKVIKDTYIPPEIEIQEVWVDEEPALAKKHLVRAVPTLILLDEEGKEIKRHTGSLSATALMEFLEQVPCKEPWKEPWKETW